MREILFRGKQVNDGMWIQGYLFQFWGRAYILWGMTNDTPTMHEVKPETIGQFTGLTDKNGKRVFEGDIVAFTAEDELWEPHYYQGSVYFCDGTFWVDCGKDNDDNDVLFSIGHALLADKNIQVIGNIHDNPELLT
jgi:uncharacterized phage protein (TIGR01671 family)